MNHQLTIIYRACNKELNKEDFNQSRPEWFSKYKCWKSFYNNFGDNEQIKIIVVFDGLPTDELAKYIRQFKVDDIVYLDYKGNKDSLLFCYDLMTKQESKYLGLFEDDYLWQPDSYKIAEEGLLKFGGFGTISLYQHPDRITRQDDITLGREYITVTNSCYWRTAESNTATFLIQTDLFKKLKQEFIDCHVQDRLLFTNLLKKYKLRHFTPISVAYGCTHVNRFFPAFFVDWEKYNESIS